MAINTAFEPDNNDEIPASTIPTQKTESTNTNGHTPNENTSFNVHLDTYFSDERIRIPDQVNISFFFSIFKQMNNHFVHVFLGGL